MDREASPAEGAEREIPAEGLAAIHDFYDRGLMLQAYAVARAFGPLSGWAGRNGLTLAGRLAGNIGAGRLGAALHRRAWRQHKNDPDLIADHGYGMLQRRGPLAVWEFFERQSPSQDSPGEGLMHFWTLRALVSGSLRDFTASEEWLAKAIEIAPGHPWAAITQGYVLEQQDRYPEALEAARRSLALHAWYRPGVQAVAHALQILDRNEEALAFLKEASEHIENLHVARQLAGLQIELKQYEEAENSLRRFEELAPLMERNERLWLQRERVKLACLLDQRPTALFISGQIDEPYYRELHQRLEAGAAQRRVSLEVPFVRQHHLTCAPATLSALSRYWEQPAEHLELAEAICYEGTPGHSERHWAETHGWIAREFTVTWKAAAALLDRGIPFTLTTSEATSGHLQAVIGYDELRQTLEIRDPFIYCTTEFLAEPLLKRYEATGPRGMALVPASRSELLDGIELPDSGLYDQLYQVQRALAQH